MKLQLFNGLMSIVYSIAFNASTIRFNCYQFKAFVFSPRAILKILRLNCRHKQNSLKQCQRSSFSAVNFLLFSANILLWCVFDGTIYSCSSPCLETLVTIKIFRFKWNFHTYGIPSFRKQAVLMIDEVIVLMSLCSLVLVPLILHFELLPD